MGCGKKAWEEEEEAETYARRTSVLSEMKPSELLELSTNRREMSISWDET